MKFPERAEENRRVVSPRDGGGKGTGVIYALG